MFQGSVARVGGSLFTCICVAALMGCGGASSLSSGGGSGTPPKKLTQVTVSPASNSMAKGTSLQLAATAIYSDKSTQDVTTTATWASDQTSVAVVNANGNLTAMGAGSAQVTAVYQTISGTSAVTVTAPSLISIAVNPPQSSLPVGDSQQFQATGAYSDGSHADLTQSVSWSSSGSGVASVSAGGNATANGVGSTTISAASGSMVGSALVTVTPAAIVSLKIVPGTALIALGSTRQFQAIAALSDGSTQDVTGLVSWNSTQPDVASISAGGLAIAQQVGDTDLRATGNGLSATADLTVGPQTSVNYFDAAAATQAGADGTIRLTNTGLTDDNLCAMLYVFDQNQELVECCGCTVTDSGLRTLSMLTDLTGNPVTGTRPKAGVIKMVPSDATQNQTCDPGTLNPKGVVLGWGTNLQYFSDGTSQVTENQFETAALSDGETTSLVNLCNAARRLGSGKGVCSCGSGD